MKNKKINNGKEKGYMTVIAVIVASITVLGLFAGLLGGSRDSPGGTISAPGGDVQLPENLPPNLVLDVDTDVKLHQNSHGAVYTKNTTNEFVDNEPVIYATNQANGDYVSIEFPDVSFKEFWESNHTQLKVSFDIIGFADLAFPTMKINPAFSENAPILTESKTKIAPLTASQFTVNTAYTSLGSVLGSFNTPGVHKFEYVFTKSTGNEFSIMVSVDEITETFVYSFTDYDFSLNSINVEISNNFTQTTAVRIANVNVGYVPALAAFPGENILIPTDSAVTALGNKTAPIYNAYLHESTIVLSEKTTLEVSNGVPGNAYASIYLKDDYKSINVFDYDYLTIDYDVSVPEGTTPVKCMAYLLGRPGGVKQYTASNSWFCADKDEDLIYGVNTEKTHMTDVVNTLHVRYVIRVNAEAETADLQVFFNDVLYYDAPGTFDSVNNCIEELRIKHFEAPGSISFANLVVNGYTSNIDS